MIGSNLPELPHGFQCTLGHPTRTPSNPHGPFGFWKVNLEASPRAPGTYDQGNQMLAISSGINSSRVVDAVFQSSLLLFRFFVVVGKFAHILDGWILYVVVVVMCSLLDLNRRLEVDSIPLRLEGRIGGYPRTWKLRHGGKLTEGKLS